MALVLEGVEVDLLELLVHPEWEDFQHHLVEVLDLLLEQ